MGSGMQFTLGRTSAAATAAPRLHCVKRVGRIPGLHILQLVCLAVEFLVREHLIERHHRDLVGTPRS